MQLTRNIVALRLENETGFEKALKRNTSDHMCRKMEITYTARKAVELLEPCPQLFVRTGIIDKNVDALRDSRETMTVRKALEESAELSKGLIELRVGAERVMRVCAL